MVAHRSQQGTSTPVVLLLLVMALALGFQASRMVGSERKHEPVTRTVELAATETVLTAVRDLARLESTSFHMERVIDLKERQTRWFGMLGANDAILLVAAGDVVAGLDLSKLRDGDIQVTPQETTVRLRLPPPEILSVKLDNQHTYVHSRKTDWLAKRNVELETQARQQAEDSIRSAALETGILERARSTADRTLTALLRSLGYTRVELTWQE